tara:strand:+ start:7 stop:645 length:639 start_codon:yes stop_codon:yes gene_type:complete
MLFKELQKKDFVVYDNLILKNYQNTISNTLLDPYFPWYLINSRSDDLNNFYSTKKTTSTQKNVLEYVKFVHEFYRENSHKTSSVSTHSKIVDQLIQQILESLNLNSLEILRAKSNLQTSNVNVDNKNISTPHIDTKNKHIVGIYYVNNSDGDTTIFKNKKILTKIQPKKGRLLFFKGDLKHSAGYPIKNQIRVVINMNFKIDQQLKHGKRSS